MEMGVVMQDLDDHKQSLPAFPKFLFPLVLFSASDSLSVSQKIVIKCTCVLCRERNRAEQVERS